MACYLRIYGEALDVGLLISEIDMTPDRVWRKGERRFPKGSSGAVFPTSGASFIASDSSMDDFDTQLRDAGDFIAAHHAAFKKMKVFPGVDGIILDFAIELRDVAVHSDYFPPAFLNQLGQLGIGLELSHYPCTMETPGAV